MTIDLTPDQYDHMRIALALAREVMEEMGPWDIDDDAAHKKDLATNAELQGILAVMPVGLNLKGGE
jgi:hypothetical protein